MRTIDYLLGPDASLFWPGVAAGVAIALQGAILSVFVVLKRMAFIGQGVSHAAFGGIGIAALLGVSAGMAMPVVAAFCILTALGVAWGAGKRSSRADELIGLFLVGSMALGAIAATLHLRAQTGPRSLPSWDAILFGSILSVGPVDAALAWASAAAAAAALFLARRGLIFWSYDEPAAEAFGARTRAAQTLLLILLAVAVVTAMKLAGVVLATALLVAPGASALRLSDRLAGVFAWSVALAVLGVGAGLAASFELDLPPGACVVGALIAIYAACCAIGRIAGRGVRRA
ncbi:MAG: metal ABC transporter permease [Phycisphaerales bacterium]|nr:metal ABC transporter permease [Phycisphaerales bacterium]